MSLSKSLPAFERYSSADFTGIKVANSRLKKLYQSRELGISFHHHYASKTFVPGSIISGDLVITPRHDVSCDGLQISFIGKSRVHHEDGQLSTTSTHNFLRLDMPIRHSAYPPSGIFLSGNTYRVPFEFTVPTHVLPSACPHHAKLGTIAEQHTRLPPSMGAWEKDDMAPNIAQIEYAINAAIVQVCPARNSLRNVAEASEAVNILGSTIEDPPLVITRDDECYKLEKTKTMRKSLLSRPLGKITAASVQASSFLLSLDGRDATQSEATVNLAIERLSSDEQPPEVIDVSAKIRAYTWYSGRPVEKLPNLGNGRGAYSTSVPLDAKCAPDSSWTLGAKGSEGSKTGKSESSYSKNLKISFSLPTSGKTFLPTFHTCLISRTYAIHMKVKVGNSTLSLAVPVQITTGSIDGQHDVGETLPSFYDHPGYA